MRPSLILSPHQDDIAFSMGGALLLGRIDCPVAFNVFTNSRYTIHGDGDVMTVSALRLQEDQAYMKRFGLLTRYFGFSDASDRNYKDEQEYMSEQANARSDIIWNDVSRILKTAINEMDPAVIYAPLAIPSMIDHRIVAEIASEMLEEGLSVIFYEDWGYADTLSEDKCFMRVNALDKKMNSYTVSGFSIDQKMSGVMEYPSQTNEELLQNLQSIYARRGGERFWGTDQALQNLYL